MEAPRRGKSRKDKLRCMQTSTPVSCFFPALVVVKNSIQVPVSPAVFREYSRSSGDHSQYFVGGSSCVLSIILSRTETREEGNGVPSVEPREIHSVAEIGTDVPA